MSPKDYAKYLEDDNATLRRELEEARKDVAEYEERELKCCPEDVGFDEMIESLNAKLAALERAHDAKRVNIRALTDVLTETKVKLTSVTLDNARKTEALRVASSVLGWVATMSDEGDIKSAVQQAKEAEEVIDAALAACRGKLEEDGV